VGRQKMGEVEVAGVLISTLAVEIGEFDRIELVEGLLESRYRSDCSRSRRIEHAVSRRHSEI